MLREFRAFIHRGNVVDLAVAVMIGTAFGAVITSLVNDVVMQLVAAITGDPDFSKLVFTVNGSEVRYGAFLNAVTSFLLIATALFFVVRTMNRAMRQRRTPPPEPPKERECPFCISTIPINATRCPACTSEVEPVSA